MESSRDLSRAKQEPKTTGNGLEKIRIGRVETENSETTCSTSGTPTEATNQDMAGREFPSGRKNCVIIRYIDQSSQM